MESADAEALLVLAEEAGPVLNGRDARAALARLEERYEELIRAADHLLETGRTDEANRLVSALNTFWMATRRLDQGLSLFERVLAAPGGDAALRGKAAFLAGLLAFWKGEDDRATALHDRALAIGREAGDPTSTALALSGHARIALRADRIEEARRLCEEAIAVSDGTADRMGRSSAMHVLAVVAQMRGDFLEARTLLTERIALLREAGNVAGVGYEAGNLSMAERQLGNLDAAEELAREALEIFYQRSDEWAMPFGFNGLAAVAAERRDFVRAATLIGAAEALIEAQGAAWPPDERPHYERTLELSRAGLGEDGFEAARTAGRGLPIDRAVALALGPVAGAATTAAGAEPARLPHSSG